MIRLKHCLVAIAGLFILIAAVARLNALDAGGASPPEDAQRVSEPGDGSSLPNGAVHALFNLGHPATAPFPSDIFTVADHSHNTGRRVNLPYPDCVFRVSDCEDVDVIDTLDGFGLQARISIPFDGPIDVTTATTETVFLISLGSTVGREDEPLGTVVGINQIVWDTFTQTLHVESDELLAQHTRYALFVTNGLRDATGRAVAATEAFRRLRQTVRGKYKHAHAVLTLRPKAGGGMARNHRRCSHWPSCPHGSSGF